MLMVSSLLLWVVIQVQVQESAQQFHSPIEDSICRSLEKTDCVNRDVYDKCVNLCEGLLPPTGTEDGLCRYVAKAKCMTDAFVKATCVTHCGLTSVVPSTACPPPWFTIGTQCFQAIGGPSSTKSGWRTWQKARDHCMTSLSGDLAHPKDLKLLADHLNTPGAGFITNYGYWLSGNDIASEGNFIWADDGNFIKFGIPGGWADARNQPDEVPGASDQNCVSMWTRYGGNGLNDYYCDVEGPFLCER